MYGLAAPPPGMSVGRVDELWDHFEKPLHEVIARAAARPETSADQITLIEYVAAGGVRHPGFAEAVNRRRAELGVPLAAVTRSRWNGCLGGTAANGAPAQGTARSAHGVRTVRRGRSPVDRSWR
jgi:hypothetical protein